MRAARSKGSGVFRISSAEDEHPALNRYLSRQSEKFLIGQSRKFLLTAKAGRMERIAMSQEERDWLEWLKRAQDGVITQRQAAEKMGVSDRWVRKLLVRMKTDGDGGCRARTAGPVVEPADRRADAGAGGGAAEAAGVARLRADVRQRAVGQAARHRGQQGDGARMDDGGGAVEGATAQTGRECISGGRDGAATANWCSGTPRITTGWKAEANRCATWCG